MQELFTFLSDIEVIEGSLSIIRSNWLTSLGFFKKLRIINGDESENQAYSLKVYGNENLRALFPQNVTIEHGRIFFHSNPKLCLNTVDGIKNHVIDLQNLTTLPIHEISPFSNGDGVDCSSQEYGNITRIGHNEVVFTLELPSHEYKRQPNGFLLYTKPAPFQNVSRFDGYGACGSNDWLVTDIPYSKQNSLPLTITVTTVKPNTQYAYYIRTYTITAEQQIDISPIKYFKTLPLSPDSIAIPLATEREYEKMVNFNGSGNYRKECPPGIIESISTAQYYRGCTHITGSLLINIRKRGGCKYFEGIRIL